MAEALEPAGGFDAPALPLPGTPAAVPGPRPALLRELGIGLAVFAVYLLVDAFPGAGRADTARRNGSALLTLERGLRLDAETPLNRWLAGHHLLAGLANYEYAFSYVLSAFILLFWLLFRRPDVYRWARTSFVWLNLVAIACFALVPVAPPRLLPGGGFVDTVTRGGTIGSWGSPLVRQANQLAAMPSLHIGWALWVSAVLGLIHGGRRSQALSAVHVALTALVILATGNHYLLDAVGGVLAVVVALWLAGPVLRRAGSAGDPRVRPDGAFFLHADSPTSPQHVGGVLLLDTSARPGGAPTREEVSARVAEQLERLPRFGQRLSPPRRWRRPRWEPVGELDWDFHIPLEDLRTTTGAPGGMAAFDALLARVAGTPLPRERPLWRLHVVHGVDVDRAAVVLVMHPAVGTGVEAALRALGLLEPQASHSLPSRPAAGPPRRTAGTACTTAVIPMEEVREAARRQGARIGDVVLSSVAGGLARALHGHPGVPARIRVAVLSSIRETGAAAPGTDAAAVTIELPLDAATEAERLADVAGQAVPLRRDSHALAAGFRMPPSVHRWLARTTYRQRFVHDVVPTTPGPRTQLSLAGAPVVWTGPLVPLPPATPLAVGVLPWNGSLCLGISADPLLVPPDARPLGDCIAAALAELRASSPV